MKAADIKEIRSNIPDSTLQQITELFIGIATELKEIGYDKEGILEYLDEEICEDVMMFTEIELNKIEEDEMREIELSELAESIRELSDEDKAMVLNILMNKK